ncbi:MAG TPA: hypothetical protein VH722_07415 [Alphaproteobacteria bacterium]|nr:hypothetical protein [Alphaproteobacteria bacterium]
MSPSPEEELERCLAEYLPEVAAQAQAALERMRRRLPGAVQLVYDNYNALAIAFSANEKLSGVLFSVAVYPRWVSLFFSYGFALDDPRKLLQGEGKHIRHIVLKDLALFDDPAVEALIAQSLALASPPIDQSRPGRLIMKSISAKRRPRRPNT